jgi:protein TonB
MVSFRVTAEGKVTDVSVLRGVDPSLDKEAVRVISMSPLWTPGKQRNKNVPVRFMFPVIFKL